MFICSCPSCASTKFYMKSNPSIIDLDCMPRIIITSTEEMCSVNISVTNDEFIPVYLGGTGGANLRSLADEERAVMHSVFDKEYCDWILYLSWRFNTEQLFCFTLTDLCSRSRLNLKQPDLQIQCWLLFTNSNKLFVFVLHHQVTLVGFLKCLRGCQNVFSKALGGIEEWLAQHTASWGSRAEHFPKCCSVPGSLISLFVLLWQYSWPLERIVFVLRRTLI